MEQRKTARPADLSTMEKTEYIHANILAGISSACIVYFYNIYFLQYCAPLTKGPLWALLCLFCSCLIGVLLTGKRHRTRMAVVWNCTIGICIYFFSLYFIYVKNLCLGFLLIAAFITVVSVLLLFWAKKRKPHKRWKYIKNRILAGLRLAHGAVGLLGLIFIITLTFIVKKDEVYKQVFVTAFQKGLIRSSILSPEEVKEKLEQEIEQNGYEITASVYGGEEYSIKNNLEILRCFAEESVWKKLSPEERQEAVCCLAAAVLHEMASPYPVTVVFSDFMNLGVRGEFGGKERNLIRINNQCLLGSAEDAGITLLHEITHYKQRVVLTISDKLTPQEKMFCFPQTDFETLEKEFRNYSDGRDDFDQYYNQEIEAEARRQSVEMFTDYVMEIRRFLEQEEQNSGTEE